MQVHPTVGACHSQDFIHFIETDGYFVPGTADNRQQYTYTLFLLQRAEIELFFFYLFLFSKLPYLVIKLGTWPKFQNLHNCCLSTPKGSKLSLYLLYWQRFPRYGPFLALLDCVSRANAMAQASVVVVRL